MVRNTCSSSPWEFETSLGYRDPAPKHTTYTKITLSRSQIAVPFVNPGKGPLQIGEIGEQGREGGPGLALGSQVDS